MQCPGNFSLSLCLYVQDSGPVDICFVTLYSLSIIEALPGELPLEANAPVGS